MAVTETKTLSEPPTNLSEAPEAVETWTPGGADNFSSNLENPPFDLASPRGAQPRPPEAMTLGILGVLLLIGGALLPWWRLAEASEPLYITACRLLGGLLSVIACGFLIQPVRRAGPLMFLGGLAILLPFLVLLVLATEDGASMSEAVHEVRQARHLMNYVQDTDANPQAAWSPFRTVSAQGVLRNEYTIFDALETGMNFAKGGWYLTIIGGTLLWIAAWMADSRAARSALARGRGYLALATLLLTMVIGVPIGTAHFYWNRARAEAGHADYAAALADYQRAAHWDPRFNYDLIQHYELGRLYGELGRTNEPDYWAMMGDMYLNSGSSQRGYQLYRRNILDPRVDPTIRIRYANVLIHVGAISYDTMQPGDAVDLWQRAYRLDPNNQEVIYNLAMGYTYLGRYPQAIALWQKLIDINNDIGLSRNKYVSSYTFTKAFVARAWAHKSWCYYKEHNLPMAMNCKMISMEMGGKAAELVTSDAD